MTVVVLLILIDLLLMLTLLFIFINRSIMEMFLFICLNNLKNYVINILKILNLFLLIDLFVCMISSVF